MSGAVNRESAMLIDLSQTIEVGTFPVRAFALVRDGAEI